MLNFHAHRDTTFHFMPYYLNIICQIILQTNQTIYKQIQPHAITATFNVDISHNIKLSLHKSSNTHKPSVLQSPDSCYPNRTVTWWSGTAPGYIETGGHSYGLHLECFLGRVVVCVVAMVGKYVCVFIWPLWGICNKAILCRMHRTNRTIRSRFFKKIFYDLASRT